MSGAEAAARAEVARVARIAAAAGLVNAFGHVSMRLPDGAMAISSTRPLLFADPADVVVVAPSGEAIGGAVADAPLERFLHLAIYRARPDVHGICRGHPESAVAWGTGTAELPVRHGLGLMAGVRVPVHPELRLIADDALGDAAARALGANHALLLHANGALAVGETPLQAAARLWAVEDRARVAIAAPAPVTHRQADWTERSEASAIELARTERWLESAYGDDARTTGTASTTGTTRTTRSTGTN